MLARASQTMPQDGLSSIAAWKKSTFVMASRSASGHGLNASMVSSLGEARRGEERRGEERRGEERRGEARRGEETRGEGRDVRRERRRLFSRRGRLSVALGRWPRYSDKDGYAGLRWSMNRRLRVGASIRFRKIWSAPSCDVSDKGSVFREMCQKKKSAEVACYLVGEGWIDPNSMLRNEEGNDGPILHAACLNDVHLL